MLGTIQLGAKVLDRQGYKLGKVKGLVAASNNGQLTHLIVENTFWLFCKKVVGAESVVELSPEGSLLQLTLSMEEFETLPDLFSCDYSENDDFDTPYTSLAGGIFSPWVFYRSYVPPLPQTITTPEGGSLVKQVYIEKLNLPDNTFLIQEGARVISQDGKLIGHLKKVSLELYSGKIKTLNISKGFLFEEAEILPFEAVKNITEEFIILGFTRSNLQFFGTEINN